MLCLEQERYILFKEGGIKDYQELLNNKKRVKAAAK